MRHAKVISSGAFRAMLILTAVMSVVLGGTGWFIFYQTTHALEDQVKARVVEDYALLADAYDRGGEPEMIKFITWATATRPATAFAFGMFTAGNAYVTGSVTTPPEFRGWGSVAAPQFATDPTDPLLAYVGTIGKNVVVVGRSLETTKETGDAAIRALSLAGGVVALAGLVTAYLFGLSTTRRLRAMARPLGQVARGDMAVRLPVGEDDDQIDYVSRQINGHLDRLAELMMGMRNTAVAIAHDLRSPLNQVSILLQKAAAGDDLEQVKLELEHGQHELDRVEGILDTILRISRIESSADTSAFTAFDVVPMLADLAETFAPVLEEHGQTLRYLPPTTPIPPVFGDRRMLQQLLVNLIENAGRYAGSGAVVELTAATSAGRTAISVADNGPGIAEAQQQSVFEPFSRLSAARNTAGTGLGLALVKAIATRHRATITLSDNHPGLRATLLFPA